MLKLLKLREAVGQLLKLQLQISMRSTACTMALRFMYGVMPYISSKLRTAKTAKFSSLCHPIPNQVLNLEGFVDDHHRHSLVTLGDLYLVWLIYNTIQ